MKIVVIGGTGMIGAQLVNKLREDGHEVIAATPKIGIDTITGEGLDEALSGAHAIVDVINTMDFSKVLEFFETSSKNLITAAKKANIKHHVVLSIVGTPLMTESPYFRAKEIQERSAQESGLPFTIVRATQFYEFLLPFADFYTNGNIVNLTPAEVQPMASRDVALYLAKVAEGDPTNGILNIGGPERFRLADGVKNLMEKKNDSREVVVDAGIGYNGVIFTDSRLSPDNPDYKSTQTIEEWYKEQ